MADDKKSRKRKASKTPSPTADNSTESGAEQQPASRRPRTHDGSGDAAILQAVPVPPSLTLKKKEFFRFECDIVGRFRMRSGSTGNLIIHGSRVTIRDEGGTLLFSQGGQADRVAIVDDEMKKTTTVTLVPGGNTLRSSVNSIINGILITGAGQISGMEASATPIKIAAQQNEPIVYYGARSSIVKGSGGHLQKTGSGRIKVYGSLQSINNLGSGSIKVKGSVDRNIEQTGSGNIKVKGNVNGHVSKTGSGDFNVHGNVNGSLSQTGSGNIKVCGSVNGPVSQTGSGNILIEQDAGAGIGLVGSGRITVRGSQRTGVVSKLGFGTISIGGRNIGGRFPF